MRLKKAFLLFFLTLFALLGGTWFILQATGAGQSIIRNILSRNLRSDYTISGADLDILDGTAEIDELNLQDPGKPEKDLISIRKVIIGLSQNPLDLGRMNVVTLSGVELHLRLGQEEVPDLSRIIASTGGDRANELPEIRLEDSRCHLYLPGAEEPTWTCDRIALHLLPREVEGRTRTYGIEGGFVGPQGLTLQLSGDLILREGERPRIRLKAACPGWRLERGFATGIVLVDRRLEEIAPTGAVSFTAWLDYPGKEGRLYGRLRLEAEDLAFTAPEFPYPVRGLDGSLEVMTGGKNALTVDLASTATTASFAIKGKVLDFLSPSPRWDLSCRAEGVSVDATLERACREAANDSFGRIWRGLAPRGGKVDALVKLSSPPPEAANRLPDASLDLELRNASLSFRGLENEQGETPFTFPYRLRQVSGRVHTRPGDLVVLEGLEGRSGKGRVNLDGTIHALPGRGKGSLNLAIEAREIALDARLRSALGRAFPGGTRFYDDYSPRGTLDASIRVERRPGEEEPRTRVRLVPRRTSASYQRFPYRLHDLEGEVAILPGLVSVDLAGRRDRSRVEVHGRFPRDEGEVPGEMEMVVTARDLPLDEELKQALAALDDKAAALWQAFAPRGRCDLEAVLSGREEPELRIGVALDNAGFRYDEFPLPVEGCTGRLYIASLGDRYRTDILGLKGTAWGSPLSLYGSVIAEKGGTRGPEIDLSLIARDLAFTPRLGDLLHRTGLMERATYDLFDLTGKADVIQRLERSPGDEEMRVTTEVQLDGVGSGSRLLFDRARKVRGTVVAKKGGLDILWLEGELGGTPVEVSRGSVRNTPEKTEIRTTILADRFPLDERMARIMAPPVDRIYLDRQAEATLRLDPLELTFIIPRGKGAERILFSGGFRVDGGRARLGLPLEGIEGAFTIDRGRLDGGGARVEGRLERVDMEVRGVPLRDISGSFLLTDKEFRLIESNIAFAGGTITRDPQQHLEKCSLVFGLAEPHPLRVSLLFNNIDLERLSAGEGGYRGSLSGHFRLEVPDRDPRSLEANFRVKAREAYIGEVPLLADLFRMLGSSAKPSFNHLKLVAKAANAHVNLEEIKLESNYFVIRGNGNYSLDGGLDLAFKASNPGSILLNPLITYRMQGTLRDNDIYIESPILPLPSSRPGRMPLVPPKGVLPERGLLPPPPRED